ncbi:MAG: hypothetical protein ACJ8C4_21810 [Gemmataceae bacterium]
MKRMMGPIVACALMLIVSSFGVVGQTQSPTQEPGFPKHIILEMPPPWKEPPFPTAPAPEPPPTAPMPIGAPTPTAMEAAMPPVPPFVYPIPVKEGELRPDFIPHKLTMQMIECKMVIDVDRGSAPPIHITCDRTNVQMPGAFQATGNVIATSHGVEVHCQTLTISWLSGQTRMDGNVILTCGASTFKTEAMSTWLDNFGVMPVPAASPSPKQD